jgi:hypothetical protein
LRLFLGLLNLLLDILNYFLGDLDFMVFLNFLDDHNLQRNFNYLVLIFLSVMEFRLYLKIIWLIVGFPINLGLIIIYVA